MPDKKIVRVGIDTGGTFTDLVVAKDGTLRSHKLLSTPQAPASAICQGLEDMGLLGEQAADLDVRIVHGTTVATNAALEGKGVKTVFVTNSGFEDVLLLGRQARKELYNLTPQAEDGKFPKTNFLGAQTRRGADGEIVKALDDDELARLKEAISELSPEAVAISLLFSYRDAAEERKLAQAISEDVGFVTMSADVLPRYGEYERGVATWLNAFLGPLVRSYMEDLADRVRPATCSVMQSSGKTLSARQAANMAASLLLSGPAGGVAAIADLARRSGEKRILSLDMGGTSADVSLFDEDIALTDTGHIGPYPVALPMIDMHTIGAGGGSYGWVDMGGMLRVGPESAGADPGPACYGRGGERPTVTDANLYLGRLVASAFLGGRMRLDRDAAAAALTRLGAPLGMDAGQAALGMLRIVNENMAQALRQISLERGRDPRRFVLCCFGGAGGLHLCALAASLGMQRALVPAHSGVFSALGMLVAPPGRELTQSLQKPIDALSDAEVESVFAALETRARAALARESDGDVVAKRIVALRYLGQSHSLEMPWTTNAKALADFVELHHSSYGHNLQTPVELVDVRLSVSAGEVAEIGVADFDANLPGKEVSDCVGLGAVPILRWGALRPGEKYAGPAIIIETSSTTFLEPGWSAEVDDRANLWLRKED